MKRSARVAAGALAAIALTAAGLFAAHVWLPVTIPVVDRLFGGTGAPVSDLTLRERLSLPAGFTVSIHAEGIPSARFMQLTPGGHILVTARDTGEVLMVLSDADGDGRSDATIVVASGLKRPHGIWLEGASLYVSEPHRIVRFDFDEAARTLSNRQVVLAGLPADGGHFTRTVKRGPDGFFYVSVGSRCNACVEDDAQRAALLRFMPGRDAEIYATGLRNTVGFDWQPASGDLYGVDSGRDWLGDDFPPDELNRIVEGGFYGWPYFNGDNVPDPDNGANAPASMPLPPAHAFGAHVSTLSITFLRHQRAEGLNGSALVAQHGSWNSDRKVGYRIVRLVWNADGSIDEVPFVTGFELDGEVIGRPVDVIEAPDGTLFVSDDHADVIYRIEYQAP